MAINAALATMIAPPAATMVSTNLETKVSVETRRPTGTVPAVAAPILVPQETLNDKTQNHKPTIDGDNDDNDEDLLGGEGIQIVNLKEEKKSLCETPATRIIRGILSSYRSEYLFSDLEEMGECSSDETMEVIESHKALFTSKIWQNPKTKKSFVFFSLSRITELKSAYNAWMFSGFRHFNFEFTENESKFFYALTSAKFTARSIMAIMKETSIKKEELIQILDKYEGWIYVDKQSMVSFTEYGVSIWTCLLLAKLFQL